MIAPRLVFGLGNPGQVYEKTRHNIGAWVISYLAKTKKINFKIDKKLGCAFAELTSDCSSIFLARSLGFMNVTGASLHKICHEYRIPAKNILVVHDDIRLGFGTGNWQEGGPQRGQNGLRSIVNTIKTEDFLRLRLGIANEACHFQRSDFQEIMAGFVLSGFDSQESLQLDEYLKHAATSIDNWLNTKAKESFSLSTLAS
jgi:PTH1 family peptidyl-tRNA hydrolase